jgi:catalase (peroxidase I)
MEATRYDSVKNDIKSILAQPDYDDGSAGPVLVRLAWHASGKLTLYHKSLHSFNNRFRVEENNRFQKNILNHTSTPHRNL